MSPELTLAKLSGPNGSGKTSVFRVLRDIWPTVCGNLAKPSLDIKELGSGNGIFFVPQRPYTCLGTLRDQIIYPLSKEEAKQRAAKLYTSGKSQKFIRIWFLNQSSPHANITDLWRNFSLTAIQEVKYKLPDLLLSHNRRKLNRCWKHSGRSFENHPGECSVSLSFGKR